jgi:hypothetical protein
MTGDVVRKLLLLKIVHDFNGPGICKTCHHSSQKIPF